MKDLDIKELEKLMEEMANAPREEMGQRQPGEKGAYERYTRMGTKVSTELRKET